jgi:rod shape-determining protein MreD
MIRTIFASTFISSLFLIIQTTWLKNGLFWGVIPDFALLVVLWVSYSNKDSQGAISGFLTGIVCDLLSSSPLGYFPFLYVAPAYAASFLRHIVSMDTFFIPVLIGFSGTVIKGISSAVLLIFFGPGRINAYSLGDLHFWIEAVLNGAVSPLIFFILKKMSGLLVTKRASE